MTQRPTSRSARRRSQRRPQNTPPPQTRNRTGLWVAIAGGVAAIAILAFAFLNSGIANSTSPGSSPGASGDVLGTTAGWQPDPPGLRDRLTSHNLPVLTAEGTVLHIHEHIDIWIDGQQLVVPADIGIDQTNGILSPLHTHDTTGVIHVESPTVRDFTLGDFFDVWGLTFNSQCLGTYCANGNQQLTVYVDGNQVKGDPRAVVLQPHQEIVVAYGTPAQLPNPIPSSFDFAAGL